MKNTLLAMLMLTGIGVQAQDAVISGHLLTRKNTPDQPRLVNEQRGVDLPVKFEDDNTFRIVVPKVAKGFYELGTAGVIYLEPGYRLKLDAQADSTYTFTGRGSEENMILARVKWQDNKLLPLSGKSVMFKWKVLSDPIDTFLTDLQRYRDATSNTVSASKNVYFRKLVEEHVNCYALNLLALFKRSYGLDSGRYETYMKLLNNKDPKDSFYVKRLQRAQVMVMKKILREQERKYIDSLYTSNFDWNNEILFDNSTEYQKTLIAQTELLAGKNATEKDAIRAGAMGEAKSHISSPKMLAFVLARLAIQ